MTGRSSGRPAVLFLRDVRRSVDAWRRDPRLPLTALAVALLSTVPAAVARATGHDPIFLVGVVATLALLGFIGTERLWYVAADHGDRLPWSDVRRFTRRLWRRYLGLGIYVSFLVVVPVVAIVAVTDQGTVAQSLLLLLVFAAIDIALTFATVVLAFAELAAGDAVRHSLAVVREQWPACLYYVLVAPLAVQLFFTVVPRDSMSIAVLVPVIVSVAVFKLLCQGATVLFYADRYLVPESRPLTGPGDVL
jgi:hypothetical protein